MGSDDAPAEDAEPTEPSDLQIDDATSDRMGASLEVESDDVESFAFFSLNGDRFEASGMPAETAREVGNFRDAVLQLAREAWLEANPGRQRVPNGFDEGFDLRLITVNPGSARPQMVLNRPASRQNDQDWDEWSQFYTFGRDRLTNFYGDRHLDDASSGAAAVGNRALAAIKRIGSSLGESESITVGAPGRDGNRSVVDRSVRDLLQSIDELLPSESVEVELEGFITEFDSAARSFRLRTSNGESLCRLESYNPSLATFVRSALALDGLNAPDVRVTGNTLDDNGRNLTVFNVRRIVLVRGLDEKLLLSQIQRAAGLGDGWLGPGSRAIAPATLVAARSVASDLRAVPGLSIVPSARGAVVFERRLGSRELSAAIEPNGQLFLCDDDTDTEDLWEDESDLDAARLVRFIKDGARE